MRLPRLRRILKLVYWTITFRIVARTRERIGAGEIRASGLFDADWYLEQNPDVAESRLDPLTHFVRCGGREGRDPSPYFDSRFYLEQNPDVAERGANPLLHYLRSGAAEGRNPSPTFDTKWYLDSNPFVAEAAINPLVHYVQVGSRTGRQPRPTPDEPVLSAPPESHPSELSPPEPAALPVVEGSVDRYGQTGVFGWARDAERPGEGVLLEVHVDGVLVSNIRADRFRGDLAARFADSGRYGFAWEVPPITFEDRAGKVEIRPRSGANRIRQRQVVVESFVRAKRLDGRNGTLEPRGLEWVSAPPRSSREDPPRVEVIVLNRDGAEPLERFLESFHRFNTYGSVRITIIDHGSRDESEKVVERWRERLPIRWVARGGNYSFSDSNNLGARTSDAEILVFANNDLTLCSDPLGALVGLLDDPDTGLVGIKLLDSDFDLDLDGNEGPPAIQHLGVHFDRFRRAADRDLEQLVVPFETRSTQRARALEGLPLTTPAATGAFLACRRSEFLEWGGFYDGYFYGYEDVDLCLRVGLIEGRRIVCANHLTAYHERARSRRRLDPESARRILANRQLLDQRLGYAYRRALRADLFERPGFWSVSLPRIAFAVTRASETTFAGDYFSALELARELEAQFPCECFFLERDRDWYDLRGVDVLIAMLDQYDPEKIENASPHLLKIAWVRNWFDRFADAETSSGFDLVWASSSKAADFLGEKLSKPVVRLPLASAADRFRAGTYREELASDYCFTGHFWNEDRDIVSHLDPSALRHRGKIFGNGWENVEATRPIAQGALPYDRMPDVYASTKIVIDDANHVTKPWGSVNSRVFDGLSAGALVVTNGVHGSQELFDGTLPTYESSEELEELLRRYLEDEEARVALVRRLREVVESKHTYRHRARSVWRRLCEASRTQLRIAIKIGTPTASLREEWGDYHFARSLKRALDRHGHSTRIDCIDEWHRPEAVGDDVVILLRGLSAYEPRPDQINLLWVISHPDKLELEECERFDHVFVASPRFADHLRSRVSVPVSTLLQCTDPELFRPREEGDLEAGAGVVFVGNSRNVFRPIVRDCLEAGIDLRVFGNGWERFLQKGTIAATNVPNRELREIYAGSSVVLNDHWQSMREWGFLSNRLFDATACGALLVSDPVEGMSEIFGDVVLTYSHPAELPGLLEKAEDAARLGRAERLRVAERVRAEHSFAKRALDILAVASELDRRRAKEVREERTAGGAPVEDRAARPCAPPFPPTSLMFMDRSPEEMLERGQRLIEFVADRGHLVRRGSILDVGCGYGRLAYTLLDRQFSGSYVGCDVLKRQIEWLQANFVPHAPGFEFRHLDVHNERYNPGGRLRATEVRLPRRQDPPDLILAFSVFTHMYPDEVAHYLREIASLMGPRSVLCATFFLLNDSWERCEAEGLSVFPMPHRFDDHCRIHDLDNPLHAIGYDESWLRELLARTGLTAEINLGSWCGRKGASCFQDTLFLRLTSAPKPASE